MTLSHNIQAVIFYQYSKKTDHYACGYICQRFGHLCSLMFKKMEGKREEIYHFPFCPSTGTFLCTKVLIYRMSEKLCDLSVSQIDKKYRKEATVVQSACSSSA